ncbi:MAG TPA: pseudouridine synthase [Patescibacteria group bacterium]|nr:pseudouridine synthase [Patescibacteria group bacterium]
MRINKFVALSTGMSRRAADAAIAQGRVLVNGELPSAGYDVTSADRVSLDGTDLRVQDNPVTIIFNKPTGYVVSRKGQGSKTIYDLLPPEYHHLKPVGRLDKDSSGLLLLTNDGNLANELTHPRYAKTKLYQVELDKPLTSEDKIQIEKGIVLDDGISHLDVSGGSRLEVLGSSEASSTYDLKPKTYRVAMAEGRNRQIRRTFAALGYEVKKLRRTQFGSYSLAGLTPGSYTRI